MRDDILEPELSVVFCGTASAAQFAAAKQYYARQGDGF
jgi:G:T/U-mismatch repair DNA glycosylase